MPNEMLTPFDDEEILRLRDENTRRRSTHHFIAECCEELRAQIVASQSSDIVSNVPSDGPPQLFIIIGPPASGKSTLVNKFKETMPLKVVDSDEIKALLPEFSNGRHAGVVHTESANLNLEVFRNALHAGANVVLPVVGRTPNTILDHAYRFNAYGYDVHLYCKYVSPKVAAQRAVTRLKKGEIDPASGERFHRFVDPLYVLSVGDIPLKTYAEIKDNDIFKTRKLITE